MKKIILTNLLILLLALLVIFIIFTLINLAISGQPRYWEIVHNKNIKVVKKEKEKIIQLKRSTSNIVNFFNVNSDEYKKFEYSGIKVNGNCGSIENGYHELIYKADKFGFRENKDLRYIISDFVLLGDSFTVSVCENKPNDLKSSLLEKTNFSFLNLGVHGTDYPDQALNLIKYAKDTNFKGLIWFFYEGNDYEKKSFDVSEVQKTLQEISNVDYNLTTNHEISTFFQIKVWVAEFIRGPSVLIKFFKKYDNLLDVADYDKVLNQVKEFLDKKKIKENYIVYIPSWQKLSLYKLKKFGIFEKHPQIKQLNTLKNNVKKIAEKNSFIFIDTDDYFLKLKDPLKVYHYDLNTHFNKKGYEHLANSVVKNLRNE